MSVNLFKLRLVALNTRYTPVIMAVINYIHVICLLFGHRGFIAENVAAVGIVPAAYILINEFGYGFCWLHKNLVAYSVLVFACINIQRHLGFGLLLPFAHLAVFAYGSFLLGTLFIRWKQYERCNKTA